ncbi:MAG TPA: DUF819 family protein [Woeseiaceae bacterium]|nr:DUF819 family protein [Woeseiaceae bacterium]
MIRSTWPYLALMLLAAGVFPALERRYGWRLFAVAPPIVLVYLLVTALAVAGAWESTAEIRAAQSAVTGKLVPALLFLLMINCDLRAIVRLGPRVLAVFFCTTASLFSAFVTAALLYRGWLPSDAWQPLGALAGSWAGGTANMIAVKEALEMPESLLTMSLVTDALCYSAWVAILFSLAGTAPAFNRWTRARSSAEMVVELPRPAGAITPEAVLVWIGLSLAAAAVSAAIAASLPTSSMISATTWTILLATGFGLVVAHTPLARYPGADRISGALLIAVIAVLASQSDFRNLGDAPLFVLAGATVIALHAAFMLVAARLFRFDLYLCGISSLAHIGGVAAAPLLAASYARALVPVAILLALLGYVIGTGYGLFMARLLAEVFGG